jgi:hypothetical protein
MRHTIVIAAALAAIAPAALAVPVLQQSVFVQSELAIAPTNQTISYGVPQCACILTGAQVGIFDAGNGVYLANTDRYVLDNGSLALPTVISGPGFITPPVVGQFSEESNGRLQFFIYNNPPLQEIGGSVLQRYQGTGSVPVVDNTGPIALDFGPGAQVIYTHNGLPLNVDYSYYSHAAPALSAAGANSVFIDFGEVKRNSGLLTQSVNLFNTAQFGSDTLDLLSAKPFNKSLGKTFTTTLAPFTGQIDGGSSEAFNISLNTNRAGYFLQSYTLNFADTNIGGIGEQSYAPEHIVVAGIVDPSSNILVPAPGAAALLGLGGLALIARRRRA